MSDLIINDLASLKRHSRDLDAELTAVFAKYGMKVSKRRSAIGGGVCRFTIECAVGSDEDRSAIAAKLWTDYADMCGVPADAFGAEITLNGERFKVVGLDVGKPKNCVSLRRLSDGKSFKCPPDTLRISLMRSKAAA